MGMILKDVHEIVPTGKIMGTKVSADILVVAAIANWGAYAIEACLAAALHLPEALHPLAVEQRVADASSRAGLIDPTSGIAHGWVDGTPPICSESDPRTAPRDGGASTRPKTTSKCRDELW